MKLYGGEGVGDDDDDGGDGSGGQSWLQAISHGRGVSGDPTKRQIDTDTDTDSIA